MFNLKFLLAGLFLVVACARDDAGCGKGTSGQYKIEDTIAYQCTRSDFFFGPWKWKKSETLCDEAGYGLEPNATSTALACSNSLGDVIVDPYTKYSELTVLCAEEKRDLWLKVTVRGSSAFSYFQCTGDHYYHSPDYPDALPTNYFSCSEGTPALSEDRKTITCE